MLNYDYIFIDESSMVDAPLFSLLLERISDTTRLILIGDVDQLPSVGPGLILRDLIDSGKIPVTRLNELFRQAKDSQININSHKIIKGDANLELDYENKSDFYFWKSSTINKCKQRVLDCFQKCLNKGYTIDDICILTPMKDGDLGTVELNKIIQSRFNPSNDFYRVDGMNILKVGDRVMQTTNNYTLDVFNGEIGEIESIYKTSDNVSIRVNFGMISPAPGEPEIPKVVTYNKSDLKEIVLSYCMTIHKSQGSEFGAVICIVTDEHVKMLNRNLIYTAWTRAKEVVLNIGQKTALEESIKSMEHMSRNSRIIEKLHSSL
jgi:exodeoxyribonuclease V alpha subunit